MGYFNALGYRLFVKAGTTSSTTPTASTGMTEVLSLTDSPVQGSSQTQEVLDYGSALGFTKSIVTRSSYTIPCQMNLDLRDAGYKVLKQAFLDSASGVTVEWFRQSPEMTSTGDPEIHAGVAFVTDFQEQITAGNVATVSFTLQGYGAPTWTAEDDT